MSSYPSSVFGNVHLGYVVIETQKFGDWKRFARDAIGMHIDELDADAMRFRLDANECRVLLRRGPAEDVVALGWQLDDHTTFDEISRRVLDHGVPSTEGGTTSGSKYFRVAHGTFLVPLSRPHSTRPGFQNG